MGDVVGLGDARDGIRLVLLDQLGDSRRAREGHNLSGKKGMNDASQGQLYGSRWKTLDMRRRCGGVGVLTW